MRRCAQCWERQEDVRLLGCGRGDPVCTKTQQVDHYHAGYIYLYIHIRIKVGGDSRPVSNHVAVPPLGSSSLLGPTLSTDEESPGTKHRLS